MLSSSDDTQGPFADTKPAFQEIASNLRSPVVIVIVSTLVILYLVKSVRRLASETRSTPV